MDNNLALRSFDFLGGQNALPASDGVGVRLLYRCGLCQWIWLQDGKRIALNLQDTQIQELAHELNANLAMLPSSTCRLCLYRAGGGVIEIDEYGKGKGFGFSWECPHPTLIHALVSLYSHDWLAKQADPEAQLPDVVTRPEKMRAVLAWFVESLPPRQIHPLTREMLSLFKATNQPGFGQPGTKHWQWKGWVCEAHCPPLGGKALLMLAVAQRATANASFPTLYPIWQSLAFLALLGSVAGEKRPGSSPDEQASSRS